MMKRKALSWLLAMCLLGGLVAMPGVAGAADMPELEAPAMTIAWDDANDPDNWTINLTRDEEGYENDSFGLRIQSPNRDTVYGMSGPGTGLNGMDVDISAYVLEEGAYTATFWWDGPNEQSEEDNVTAQPITRAYTKPGPVFGTPKNPAWDGTKATWEAPTDAVVPVENARYLVTLHAGTGEEDSFGDYFDKKVALADLEEGVDYSEDMQALKSEFPNSVYYFTVRVLSDKIGTTAHSAESVPSSRIKADGTSVGGGTTPDPDPEKLPAPATVTFNANYTVNFTAVTDATGYIVQLYKGASGSGTKVGASQRVTGTTANLGALVTTAGDYYVGVVAESADGAAYNSDEKFSTTQAYVERLPMPSGIVWSDGWSVSFAAVTGATKYNVQLYKGALGSGTPVGSVYELNGTTTVPVADFVGLDALGDYYVGIVAIAADPDLNSLEAFSGVKTLAKLGTPGGLRWEKTASGYAAAWNAATGIATGDKYTVTVYDAGDSVIDTETVAGTVNQAVFTLTEGSSYTFTVQAIHGEFAFANGDASGKSAVQNVVSESAIIDVVDKIANDLTDAAEARRALNNLDQAALANAMQGNESLRGDIQKIEAEYAKDKTIAVNHTVEQSLGFAKTDVEIIGAGFSAITGTTIGVEFTKPAQNADVDLGGYTSPVQVNIDLKSGGMSITPVTPVTITMPIPSGVAAQNLVILHVLRSGAIERIYPRINGDGTVTFTVTEFSPFIFVNQLQQSGSGTTGGSGGDGSWPSGYNPVPAAPAAPPASPAPSVPTANFYRVMARSLNQRGGPGTNYPVMGKLTQNELIRIVGFSADGLWAQTESGRWLSMAYLSGTSAVSGAGNFTVNVSSSLNVRSGAGTTSATIGKLYAGAAVRALSVEKGWALIEYNGGTAYVSAMYLK